MADRPILFSGPMIRALLEGQKTQTRRVLKLGNRRPDYIGPRGCTDDPSCWGWDDSERGDYWLIQRGEGDKGCLDWSDWAGAIRVGDRLWVKERFAVSGIGWGKKPSEARGGKVHYHADPEHGWQDYWGNWRPSIHMPRWASRLTLIVTDVRVQRLQDISEADAVAEGIRRRTFTKLDGTDPKDWWVGHENGRATAKAAFRDLWDSLNADRAPWDSNPWVCAVSFTVLHSNIDRLSADAPTTKPATLEGVS